MILSMTTWAPRRDTLIKVWEPLLSQLTSEVKPVIIVAYEDYYPLRHETDYLSSKGVQVVYCSNIKSHKKLMPVLSIYPNEPILVVDDDVIQDKNWLHTFVEDHCKYPNDIIYGQGNSFITLNNNKIVETLCDSPNIPNDKLVKFASGASGTLFPPNTFTIREFFQECYYMTIAPYDDETWQFAFALMEGHTLRKLSSCNIPSSAGANQECALNNINKHIYSQTHNRIADHFPAYKQAIKERLNALQRSYN